MQNKAVKEEQRNKKRHDMYKTQKYKADINLIILVITLALDGVAQWIECWTVNQWITSSIPSQSTCLGCWPGPQ